MTIGTGSEGSIKIDSAETDGLLGVHDSLAYRVAEIERHMHHRERWFGLAVTPIGETHVADEMNGVVLPFTLTAGNSDFGSWVQILGSDDTPHIADSAYFDAHRFLVTVTNSTNPFIIQIVAGELADLPAIMAADGYTSAPYKSATNNNDSGIEIVSSRRVAAGTKVWARCACVGANGTTLSAYIGLHEYEG